MKGSMNGLKPAVNPDADDTHNVRTYVTYMATVAVAIKVGIMQFYVTQFHALTHMVVLICDSWQIADNTRRILLYTAPHHKHKDFFAVARGFFPVQELCSIMSALHLAGIDLLQKRTFRFYAAMSAVILHAMANIRGMKPLYVWDSSRPWDELQLQAWDAESNATPQQLLLTGGMNLLWFMVLFRHLSQLLTLYFRLSKEVATRRGQVPQPETETTEV